MPYVYPDTCGAGFHSNVHSCPNCGARAKRVHERHSRRSGPSGRPGREDVELEVRDALYGRRSGTVERLASV
jgi:hypothetical protein